MMRHPDPLRYEFSGLFYTEAEWIHPTRIIDTYELIYVVNGQVYLEEEGMQFSLQEGDLYLLRPGCRHRGWKHSQNRTSFYWVHFRIEAFEWLHIRPGLFSGPGGYQFAALFRQLLHLANTPGYPPYAVEAALGLLLGELCSAQKQAETTGSPLVCQVAEWIRINSAHHLTVEETASKFGYHPDYLCSLFRKNLGRPLKQYITGERIKLAKSLLLTTNLTIQQLAGKLEWENANQFTHYFRYHEGISPARYRRLYSHTHMNNH